MNVRFVQDGDSVDFTPAADIAAGDVVVQGNLVGVAKRAIATGVLGALAVSGVFDFPKATGASTAITAGALCYWDDTANVATTDAAAGVNKLIGASIAAATDAASTVRILLRQG